MSSIGQKPLPPKIEFPCDDYPIKVLGDSAEDYLEFVINCVSEYTHNINSDLTKVQASRNGRFTSVTLFITATGAEQLESMHQALKQSGRVKMVL